jgi:hypothetical protein
MRRRRKNKKKALNILSPWLSSRYTLRLARKLAVFYPISRKTSRNNNFHQYPSWTI